MLSCELTKCINVSSRSSTRVYGCSRIFLAGKKGGKTSGNSSNIASISFYSSVLSYLSFPSGTSSFYCAIPLVLSYVTSGGCSSILYSVVILSSPSFFNAISCYFIYISESISLSALLLLGGAPASSSASALSTASSRSSSSSSSSSTLPKSISGASGAASSAEFTA